MFRQSIIFGDTLMDLNGIVAPLAKLVGLSNHQVIVALVLIAVAVYTSYVSLSAGQEGGGMKGYPLDYTQNGGGVPFHQPVPQCNQPAE